MILGSGGFIGKALSQRLPRQLSIATASKNPLAGPYLDSCVAGLSIVYLCAGRTGGVGRMTKDPFSFIYPNVRIQMNVIEACVKAGVKRLVILQSTTGYPDSSEPMSEEDYLTGEVHPAYFAPGHAGRFIQRLSQMVKGMEIIFFRPSNVYGPGNNFDPQTSHVIEATVRKVSERQDPFEIWGNGSEVRDAIYIDDLVDAIALADDPEFPPGAYNVGTGTEMSVDEMVVTLFRHAKFFPKVEYNLSKPTAIPARRVNISKLESYGWKAKVSMEEGLKKTYDWYQSR